MRDKLEKYKKQVDTMPSLDESIQTLAADLKQKQAENGKLKENLDSAIKEIKMLRF
jgi:peptidoglycan hydrolase CwlO-like protein